MLDMVIDPINATAVATTQVVGELSKVVRWVQALGIFVLLWVIFQSIRLYLDWKKVNSTKIIKSDLDRIEKKINKISKSSKHR